jgi:transcriptional regulator with XRE-family HTH domain
MQDLLSGLALKRTAILRHVAKKPNQTVVSKQDIGLRIKLLRQGQGLTQIELGERLEMTQSNLSAIERGIRGVTVHQVVRVAKALGVATDEILMAEKAPPPGRRPRKRLMKRLQRIQEIPERDQRIVLQLLEGLLMRHQEKLHPRAVKQRTPTASEQSRKPAKDSRVA